MNANTKPMYIFNISIRQQSTVVKQRKVIKTMAQVQDKYCNGRFWTVHTRSQPAPGVVADATMTNVKLCYNKPE